MSESEAGKSPPLDTVILGSKDSEKANYGRLHTHIITIKYVVALAKQVLVAKPTFILPEQLGARWLRHCGSVTPTHRVNTCFLMISLTGVKSKLTDINVIDS